MMEEEDRKIEEMRRKKRNGEYLDYIRGQSIENKKRKKKKKKKRICTKNSTNINEQKKIL